MKYTLKTLTDFIINMYLLFNYFKLYFKNKINEIFAHQIFQVTSM